MLIKKETPHYTLFFIVIIFLFNTVAIHFFRKMSVSISFTDYSVYIAYLPYAYICAQLYILKRIAYLPLCLAYVFSSWGDYHDASLATATLLTCCIVLPLILSGECLQHMYGVKWSCGYLRKHSAARLIIISLVCPLASKLIMIAIGKSLPSLTQGDIGIYFATEKYHFNIINLMHLPFSALVFFPVFYNLHKFVFQKGFRSKSLVIFQNVAKHIDRKIMLWFSALILVNTLYFALSQSVSYRHYFTGAVYPLLLLLFVYGIQKHALPLVMMLWSLTVYALLLCLGDYLTPSSDAHFIASFMSVIIVFSIALQYLAVTKRNYQGAISRLKCINLINSSTGLRNVRALAQHCHQQSSITLCLIEITNLYLLGKYYGPAMAVQAKQRIAQHLMSEPDLFHAVYDPDNNQLIVQIDENRAGEVVPQLKIILRSINFSWNDTPLNYNFRLAWSVFHLPKARDINSFVHHLSFMAKNSDKIIIGFNDTDPELSSNISHLQGILGMINNALFNKNVLLYKQPIHGVNGDVYFEILSRLNVEDRILTPDVFLPVITEINCTTLFDLIVIEKTAKYLHRNKRNGISEKLSINIMPASLNTPDIAQRILDIFADYGVAAETVIFEITEDEAVIDSENATSNIRRLTSAGFKLAIDDFGVRHSNFERLSILRADILKIDGLFIKNITTDAVSRKIVESICNIAKLKNMSVVAEYVETSEQYDYLCETGVEYFQGYYFGKPELCS
ncbi:MAG TPA: EAL domain-containing protein [Buttiauxella sp.]